MKFTKEEVLKRKAIDNCKKQAIKKISICYHPQCTEPSINSHILQKNGILSSIAPDAHLWHLGINNFDVDLFEFERKGLRQIFSFNCFCNYHDRTLFSKIEGREIDFDDYESQLLFSVRILYNELFRKEVNIDQFNCLIKNRPEYFDNNLFRTMNNQHSLAVKIGRAHV